MTSKSAAVRTLLDHPVIDTGLHTSEFAPALDEYIAKHGGVAAVDEFRTVSRRGSGYFSEWYELRPDQRAAQRTTRPPRNMYDLATMSLPRLLHERLAESGTDYAVLLPNVSAFATQVADADLRRALIRAVNEYHRDAYAPYADRLTPVAAIPLHTPEEGIEELEYAISNLGLKVALIPGNVRRPSRAAAERYSSRPHPDVARHAGWLDTFGLDSEYDYDSFWAKAVALKTVLVTHSGAVDGTGRSAHSSPLRSDVGHFAAAAEALAKSLFFGGVTRRFSNLRVGFLDGGAGWGARLYADLVEQWERRDGKAVRNDFAKAGIEQTEDIRDRYVPNFYFGSEAADPTLAYGFDTKVNPLGARMNAFWASDSGDSDAADSTELLSDTWSPQNGALSEQNFKDLVFTHPHAFLAGRNPHFFKGTQVEQKLQRSKAA